MRSYGAGQALRKAMLTGLLITAGVQARAEAVIAVLGDSLTAGYGLGEADGFVAQMNGWLTAQGVDARVVNASVSGDTTAGGLARFDWSIGAEVEALAVELGANDMLRGIDPAVSRANLDAILARGAARGMPMLVIGISAPGNYGSDYKTAFEGMFPDLAEAYAADIYPNIMAPLAALPMEEGLTLMQADRMHPNQAGVALIVEELGPYFRDLIARVAK